MHKKILSTVGITLGFAVLGITAPAQASAPAVVSEPTMSVQTVKEARFTNDKKSVTQLGARASKNGKTTLVNKGGKAPKGTKYIRVFANTEAWYRGLDGRASGPTWKKLKHGTHRVIVTRHYVVKWAK